MLFSAINYRDFSFAAGFSSAELACSVMAVITTQKETERFFHDYRSDLQACINTRNLFYLQLKLDTCELVK